MARILIVDDLQTERDNLGRLVTLAGHQPFFAIDGEEGIAQARSQLPALIFMDVVMPKMDGFSACRRLKRDPATAAIPIWLVTRKDTENDRFWGAKQGADGYLAKPYQPERIKQILATIGRKP